MEAVRKAASSGDGLMFWVARMAIELFTLVVVSLDLVWKKNTNIVCKVSYFFYYLVSLTVNVNL
jgi:hypothetical protein